jgi:hypothetical protein
MIGLVASTISITDLPRKHAAASAPVQPSFSATPMAASSASARESSSTLVVHNPLSLIAARNSPWVRCDA